MTGAPAVATFGELTVERAGHGFVIRGPGNGLVREVPPDPDAIRELVRFDAAGRFRPLSGALGLPGGWLTRCRDKGERDAVLEAVYPLATKHIQAAAEERLPVTTLDAVLARQTGRYEDAAALSNEGRARAAGVLCGRCVRVPAWRGHAVGRDQIPCPEPCSVLVALCRESARWERNPPAPHSTDPTVPFAQFEAPGNEVREAYLASRSGDVRG